MTLASLERLNVGHTGSAKIKSLNHSLNLQALDSRLSNHRDHWDLDRCGRSCFHPDHIFLLIPLVAEEFTIAGGRDSYVSPLGPENSDLVLAEGLIVSYDRKILQLRLSDQHAIKRIIVIQR